MGIAIGIDLGTTFSVVSYLKDGTTPTVIPNDYGNRTTPSVVCIDNEGNFYVGEAALDLSQNFPSNQTIQIVKRKMGSNHRYTINHKEYSPEQISSEILKYLKTLAEKYTGQSVESAVITVPAYFNNDQRQSTKIAGELAGLNVSRIINEPTAASLAYGLDSKKDCTILVFDLGGGTFDVTILKLSDGVDFHVLSTSGNTNLGGVDFDEKLADLALTKFIKTYESQNNEIFSHVLSEYEKNKLIIASEKTKKLLSLGNKGYITIPHFIYKMGKSYNLQESVTREEFENSIVDLVDSLKSNIDQATSDAKIKYSDIDEVVFVGGSTRIPFISQKVKEWTNKTPNQNINPDEAVSIGAAIQASVLAGKTKKEVFLIDVIPLSLGIETQGGIMTPMITRNSQIPTEIVETFTTAFDNQTSVDVKVFQGERPQTKNNHYLGEFKLADIPELPRGLPKIQVTFCVDANGILTVKGFNEQSGMEKSLTLTGSSSLSENEMIKMLKDAEENKISDEIFLKISSLQNWLYDYLIQIDQLLSTKVLDKTEEDELLDLKISIETDKQSNNIELLNSLVYSSKELVEKLSDKVYNKAKSLLNG